MPPLKESLATLLLAGEEDLEVPGPWMPVDALDALELDAAGGGRSADRGVRTDPVEADEPASRPPDAATRRITAENIDAVAGRGQREWCWPGCR
jgi:hypothetical protein